ncbi:MAG TPA: DinB family protein [Vicinamibacterales bacterium]|nr:DinB family protein [Vicinamibacterales bacterium]
MLETFEQYTARLLSYSAGQDPRAVLSTTGDRLRGLIEGRTREELSRADGPARWSVAQILAHLADAEIVAAWRFRSILAQDAVAVQPYDQDVWADAFKYAEVDPADSLRVFDVNRKATLALVQRVDPARHNHHGMHAERGRESIQHLLHLYAGHDLNHLTQVERLLTGSD